MRKQIILGLLLLFATLIVKAQSISYTNYTVEDGLPSNTIYSVKADNQGFIWIATDYGVSIFDGYEFITYTKSDGLADNEIFNFYVDSQDRVWFYSFNGKMSYYYEGNIYNESNVSLLKKLKLSSRVSDIREDKYGNLYFLGDEGNILQLSADNTISELAQDEKAVKNFLIKAKSGEVFSILRDETEIKSLLSNETRPLNLADIRQEEYSSLLLSRYPSHKIYKHFFKLENIDDIKGPVNIQKQDSIYWIYGNETPLRKSVQFGNKLKVVKEDKEIFGSSAYLDQENNLWISTFGRGLFKINNHIENQFIIGENLDNDLLSSMLVFDEKILLGTESGALHLIEENTIQALKWPTYDTKKIVGPSRTKIRKIHHGPNGNILVMKNQGLFSFSNDLSRIDEAINGTFKDLDFDGNQMVLAKANNAMRYDAFSLQNYDYIYDQRSTAILSAIDHSVWIGTNKGLLRSTTDRQLDTIDYPVLKESNINSIEQLSSGLIIVGTNGDGMFSIYKNKINRITTEDGILGNIIKHVFLDEDDEIWASTNRGISNLKFSKQKIESIQNFTKDDGLSSNNIIQSHITTQKIYALSTHGLTVIDRNKYNAKPQNNPKILLNRVKINGNASSVEQLSNLSYKENDISFNYSSISFNNAQNMSFKYRLIGSNKGWQISKKRTLDFVGLAPGNYQFQLVPFLSINEQTKKLPDGINIDIKIKPPWYKSWLFRALSLVFLFLGTFTYVRSRIAQEKEKSKLDLKVVELQQRALLTQMNPHFINNCLSSIQQFILSGDKREANNQLSKFANLIRLIVSNSRNSSVSLKQEIEHLKLYLELEQLRFSNKFDFTVKVDPLINAESTQIPSMLFQPLVENAVLHAFDFSKRNRNVINVEFTKQGDYIKCLVKDNGIGVLASKRLSKKSHSLGIATKNIEERINILKRDKPKSSFTYEDLSHKQSDNSGTNASIVVPILNE